MFMIQGSQLRSARALLRQRMKDVALRAGVSAATLHRMETVVVSRFFRTFGLAERRPALAHAVMAPLICWSFSNSMLRYLLVDHAVPAMWRSLAAARLSAD